jgi:hypothetical protein
MGFEQNRGYTDILGEIATAPTGAAQWLTAQIGVTGFFINWLQAGQNDFFQLKLQIDHRFGKGLNLADLHAHYALSTVPVAGNTIIIDWAYVIVPINQPIPVIGSWASGTATIPLAGTETVNTHYVYNFATNIAPPANQTYSGILFFKATRRSSGGGSDTYGGNFGLLYVDAHGLADRPGSVGATGD